MKRSLENFLDEHNRIKLSGKGPGVASETLVRSAFPDVVPEKTRIDGKWSLTENHDLSLSVSASDTGLSGKTIILRGDILSPSSSGFLFRVRHCDALSGARSRTIELKGVWAADDKNRITFRAAKADGRYDVLTFNGTWDIGPDNELSYKFVKTGLKKGDKKETVIAFRGHWDLYRSRIVYSIQGGGGSFFSFKAAVQSKSLMAKKGEIRYQLGAEVSSRKAGGAGTSRAVSIFGTWKLSREFKTSFELKSTEKKKRQITFGIERVFAKGHKITVSLKDSAGEKLGMDVTFTGTFKKDAEFFLSLGRSAPEISLIGGIKLKF
jgi:hypothetical protein